MDEPAVVTEKKEIGIKLGAFYHLRTRDNVSVLVRPFELDNSKSRAFFYMVQLESISSSAEELAKYIFVKDSSREELMQFRKTVAELYKERYGRNFFGKFYLDDEQTTKNREAASSFVNLSGGNKEAKKNMKQDIAISKESKKSLDNRRRDVLTTLKTATIESEKENLRKQLRDIRLEKKTVKDRIRNLESQCKEL